MGQNRPFVLCVEDDPDTQEMLGILLKERGYDFKAVDSCAEAFRVISENGVSLLLLDNMLTDGNGIDLCRQVRQINKHLPIVFISGSSYDNDRFVALAAGANDFLTKPFEIKKLFDTISKVTSDEND